MFSLKSLSFYTNELFIKVNSKLLKFSFFNVVYFDHFKLFRKLSWVNLMDIGFVIK